jgi:hypothetical protein
MIGSTCSVTRPSSVTEQPSEVAAHLRVGLGVGQELVELAPGRLGAICRPRDLRDQVGRVRFVKLPGAQVQGAVQAVQQQRVGIEIGRGHRDAGLGGGQREHPGDPGRGLTAAGGLQRGAALLGIDNGESVEGEAPGHELRPPGSLASCVV